MKAEPRGWGLATVCELRQLPGWTGEAVRRLPDWLCVEADRWRDPWRFLLGANWPLIVGRPLPPDWRRFFLAAQSQRAALRKLTEVLRGIATVHDSVRVRMHAATNAGNEAAARRCQNQMLRGALLADEGRTYLEAAGSCPELEAELRKRLAAIEAADRRKLGRRAYEERLLRTPKARQAAAVRKFGPGCPIGNRIAWWLVTRWLGDSSGTPGFCWYCDEAITQVLRVLLKLPELPWLTVRTMRRRLGLKNAHRFITKAVQGQKGGWKFFDRMNVNVLTGKLVRFPR